MKPSLATHVQSLVDQGSSEDAVALALLRALTPGQPGTLLQPATLAAMFDDLDRRLDAGLEFRAEAGEHLEFQRLQVIELHAPGFDPDVAILGLAADGRAEFYFTCTSGGPGRLGQSLRRTWQAKPRF